MSSSMDTSYIGVRFILEHGSFFQAIMQKAEARKLIQSYIEGMISKETIGGLDTNSPMGAGSWAVKVKSIIGVHTFDLQQVQQQLTGPQMGQQVNPQQGQRAGGMYPTNPQFRSGG